MFSKRSGFTLVEVLVTLAISSMILLIGTVSLKFLTTSLAKNTSTLPTRAMAYVQIRTLIASTYPYVVYTKKPFDPNRYDYRFFVEGDVSDFTFVSDAPLLGDATALVTLSLKDNALTYTESPLFSGEIDYLAPHHSKTPGKLTLIGRLEEPSWSYESASGTSQTISGLLPSQVRLRFKRDGREVEYRFAVRSDYTPMITHLRRRLENI